MTIYNQKPEPLSDNDRELLSAYLDQQLEAEEQAHLEARLLVEPLLRAELEELRATVQIFQELQPMPLPRSFTLAADTVQQKRPWWQRGWWVWSGAGAVATLLLVFVVASTMSLGTQSASDSMPQAAQTPVSSPAIVAQAPDETTASAPPRSIIATSSITHGTPVWTQTSAVPERYATPLPSVAARSFIPRTSHVLPENPTLLSAEQTPPPGQQVILPTKPAAQPPAAASATPKTASEDQAENIAAATADEERPAAESMNEEPQGPTRTNEKNTAPPGTQGDSGAVASPTPPSPSDTQSPGSQGNSAAAARSNTLLLISTILTFLVLLSFLWFLWHNQQRKKNQ
jgi:hypothetical protein